MNDRLIQVSTVLAIIALVAALSIRSLYLRVIRKRWPVVEATIGSIDGDVRVSASAEGALGIQPEYTHHLVYSYRGIHHEVHLIHPKLHRGTIRLRVNPSNPTEAYFNDDITQKATLVQRNS